MGRFNAVKLSNLLGISMAYRGPTQTAVMQFTTCQSSTRINTGIDKPWIVKYIIPVNDITAFAGVLP
jgi:hypothetical protein